MSALSYPLYNSPVPSVLKAFMDLSKVYANGFSREDRNSKILQGGFQIQTIKQTYFIPEYKFRVYGKRGKPILSYQLIMNTHSFVDGTAVTLCLSGHIAPGFVEDDAVRTLTSVLTNNGYNVILTVTPVSIQLGNLFSRSSPVRDRMSDFIQNVGRGGQIKQHAQSLWNTLIGDIDSPAVLDVWFDLFEEEVKYQVMLTDPFCLDN